MSDEDRECACYNVRLTQTAVAGTNILTSNQVAS